MVQFRPQPPGDTLDFLYRGPHCPPLSSAVLTEYNGRGLSSLHPHWPLTEPCLQSPQYDITCCNPFSTWFFPSFLGFLFVLLTRSPVAQAGPQHCGQGWSCTPILLPLASCLSAGVTGVSEHSRQNPALNGVSFLHLLHGVLFTSPAGWRGCWGHSTERTHL